MRMMSSSGTCEPKAQGAAANEMATRLAQMQAERGRQDQMWSEPTTVASVKTTSVSSTSEIVKTNNTRPSY